MSTRAVLLLDILFPVFQQKVVSFRITEKGTRGNDPLLSCFLRVVHAQHDEVRLQPVGICPCVIIVNFTYITLFTCICEDAFPDGIEYHTNGTPGTDLLLDTPAVTFDGTQGICFLFGTELLGNFLTCHLLAHKPDDGGLQFG